MSKYFKITGYWKDSEEEFEDYIVKETDYEEDQEIDDDDIFYYELTENEIQEAINLVYDTELEFIITEYEVL